MWLFASTHSFLLRTRRCSDRGIDEEGEGVEIEKLEKKQEDE
jgi:hypothetical protein